MKIVKVPEGRPVRGKYGEIREKLRGLKEGSAIQFSVEELKGYPASFAANPYASLSMPGLRAKREAGKGMTLWLDRKQGQ